MIYLDNAATTRPCDEAVAACEQSMRAEYFNPSSLYAQGFSAKKSMDTCRSLIMSRLDARALVFTSGGTEADNLAILGSARAFRKRSRLLFSAVEHPAVKAACLALSDAHEVLELPVNSTGVLDLDAARGLMASDTALICVMQVNNEIGAIQPLRELIRMRDERCPGALLHVDGVQAFARLPVSLADGIDSYAISAHKIHGPKGIGALALGSRSKLKPIVFGGGQEDGIRSGTENTAGIAGMEAAIRAYPSVEHIRLMKLRLYQGIRERIPEVRVNGPAPDAAEACDHILNLSFPPVRAQTMMHALEGLGVIVSQGSACSSRSGKPSPILQAMGLDKNRLDSAIRFSLSHFTSGDEVDAAAEACATAYASLKNFTRR